MSPYDLLGSSARGCSVAPSREEEEALAKLWGQAHLVAQ